MFVRVLSFGCMYCHSSLTVVVCVEFLRTHERSLCPAGPVSAETRYLGVNHTAGEGINLCRRVYSFQSVLGTSYYDDGISTDYSSCMAFQPTTSYYCMIDVEFPIFQFQPWT